MAADDTDPRWYRWLSVSALVVAADQLTKWYVAATLAHGERVDVLPIFSWVRWHNDGAAFSILSGHGGWQRWFFVALAGGFTIPLIGTNALSILPLLMVGTYILQQKIQPKPADEKAAEQQKIMKFVLPMFGFLFYTMPSGLMLYFITSALWSIGEQLTIKKKIMEQEGPQDGKDDKADAKAADEGKGKKGKKKKKGKAHS